jgi:Flp pilus assembly protein TadG
MNQIDGLNRVCREDALAARGLRGRALTPPCQSGGAAIEFVLLAPLLLIMLTGLVEVGIASYQAMQVQAAAEAGVLYAVKNGASPIANVSAAVTSATGTSGITATPAPLAFCGCHSTVAGGGVVSQANCATPCSDSTAPGQYLTVYATLSHQTIMPYLNLGLPATLTSSSTVRLQ